MKKFIVLMMLVLLFRITLYDWQMLKPDQKEELIRLSALNFLTCMECSKVDISFSTDGEYLYAFGNCVERRL